MPKGKGETDQLEFIVKYGSGFLERHVGKKILNNPLVAIIELLANCWDAGATRVDIQWGDASNPHICIADNGEGMTKQEFLHRWGTLSYNRLEEQGSEVIVQGNRDLPPRRVYGRNGVGKFAPFCFNSSYLVETGRNGTYCKFRVVRESEGEKPLSVIIEEENASTFQGTRVSMSNTKLLQCSQESLIAEIALRFMGDPNFRIVVNSCNVIMEDIPQKSVERKSVSIDGLGQVDFSIIDTAASDRTMKMHGIAFQVNGRLVGEISWRHPGLQDFVDGRRLEGKRLLVIVKADMLINSGAISSDWTEFERDNDDYKKVISCVNDVIEEYLDRFLDDRRQKTLAEAKERSEPFLKYSSSSQKGKWQRFIEEVQKQCRSIKDNDVIRLAELLAKLEATTSKYAIISQLADQAPGDLEKLHTILKDWTIESAKTVLDEIQTRLVILEELKNKTSNVITDEVQELQPLFEHALWIFGPAYETIHYTSNQSMNTVIHSLMKNSDVKGSANRPDFVALPDGSVGCYSTPEFSSYSDGDASEIGIAKLVIVELKKPSVTIRQKEVLQAKKYYQEIHKKCGINHAEVECFVLGSTIDSGESEPTQQGNLVIRPLTYNTVIERAKSRLFHLDEKIRSAPFIKEYSDIVEEKSDVINK